MASPWLRAVIHTRDRACRRPFSRRGDSSDTATSAATATSTFEAKASSTARPAIACRAAERRSHRVPLSVRARAARRSVVIAASRRSTSLSTASGGTGSPDSCAS